MKRIILLITAVALIAVLAASTTVMAARPAGKPPVMTSGPSVAMESGSGTFNLMLQERYDEADPYIYRGTTKFGPYDEVRHVTLTAVAFDAGNWFVEPTCLVTVYFDGAKGAIVSGSPSQQIVTLEFAAKEWAVSGFFKPGFEYDLETYPVDVSYHYTMTFPAAIK